MVTSHSPNLVFPLNSGLSSKNSKGDRSFFSHEGDRIPPKRTKSNITQQLFLAITKEKDIVFPLIFPPIISCWGSEGVMKTTSSVKKVSLGEVEMRRKKIPSLLDLCVQAAIDNLRHIGDVGDVDIDLLKDILPHCTDDQLMHIENSTPDRDLSPVTNDLWKRFYAKEFGEESADNVIRRMKQSRVVFKWKQLYEAKAKDMEQTKKRVGNKVKQSYQDELAKKSSRKTQFTNKTPESGSKRSYFSMGSSHNVSHMKSNIMKKAKLQCLNSLEAKNKASMKQIASQGRSYTPQSVSRPTKPNNVHGKDVGSSSKMAKPGNRYG